MQRLQGDGWAFVHAGGTLQERTLAPGEMIRVDTGCIVAFQPSVNYDIQYVGKIKSALFGGEGLFFATLRGPGRVWLQSLPLSRLANRIIAAVPGLGGRPRRRLGPRRAGRAARRRQRVGIVRLRSREAASNGSARGSRFAAWKTGPPRPAHGDGVGSGNPGDLLESVGPPGDSNVIGESAPTPPGTAADRFSIFAVTPLRGRARADPLDAACTAPCESKRHRAAQTGRGQPTLSEAIGAGTKKVRSGPYRRWRRFAISDRASFLPNRFRLSHGSAKPPPPRVSTRRGGPFFRLAKRRLDATGLGRALRARPAVTIVQRASSLPRRRPQIRQQRRQLLQRQAVDEAWRHDRPLADAARFDLVLPQRGLDAHEVPDHDLGTAFADDEPFDVLAVGRVEEVRGKALGDLRRRTDERLEELGAAVACGDAAEIRSLLRLFWRGSVARGATLAGEERPAELDVTSHRADTRRQLLERDGRHERGAHRRRVRSRMRRREGGGFANV